MTQEELLNKQGTSGSSDAILSIRIEVRLIMLSVMMIIPSATIFIKFKIKIKVESETLEVALPDENYSLTVNEAEGQEVKTNVFGCGLNKFLCFMI